MVTRLEYEEALKICLQYKNQIDTEIKSITNENNLLIDMHNKGELSTRFFNNVCVNLDYFFSHLEDVHYRLYTLSDLLKLAPNEVLKLRNSGKKNMLELNKLQEKYLIKS